jgi:hypothetical protein
MQLNDGLAPAPCTAGIVPGPEDSVSFTIVQPTGIPPVLGEGTCRLFSDAAAGTVTVQLLTELPKDPIYFRIYSIDGRPVFSAPVPGKNTVFHTGLPAGTYVASLESGNGSYRKKIVIYN